MAVPFSQKQYGDFDDALLISIYCNTILYTSDYAPRGGGVIYFYYFYFYISIFLSLFFLNIGAVYSTSSQSFMILFSYLLAEQL